MSVYVKPVKVALHETERLTELLVGLKIIISKQKTIDIENNENLIRKDKEQPTNNQQQCLTCRCTLLKRDEQISHYKSDWHCYNLKIKLLGHETISKEEFSGLDECDLSISGSDSDCDDALISSDEKSSVSLSLLKQESNDNILNKQFYNRKPKLYFQNSKEDVIAVYKKVIYGGKNVDVETNIDDVVKKKLIEANNSMWLVILLSAGHFAAAVFDGPNVIVHKTFHKYIVRAKRGTVQSVNDSINKGSNAKSAGASLRRHNDKVLEDNIKSLLSEWKKEYLQNASHIFLRIPNYRKSLFYGGKESIFEASDARLRSIPFVTRRPTYNEVQRVYQELFSVTILGDHVLDELNNENIQQPNQNAKKVQLLSEQKVANVPELKENSQGDINVTDDDDNHITQSPLSNKRKKNKKKKDVYVRESLQKSEESNTDSDVSSSIPKISYFDSLSPNERDYMNRLFAACRGSDFKALEVALTELKNYCAESQVIHKSGEDGSRKSDSTLEKFLCMHLDSKGSTLLHVAAKSGHREIIFSLLQNGSDPTVKDFKSFLPYCVCPNKEARNTFRRFRAKCPDMYDYKTAQVPSPLTEENEEAIKKKQQEKKKMQKTARKEKIKAKKQEEMEKKENASEKERFSALSDREKRLIATEKRLGANHLSRTSSAKKCGFCEESLYAKVPFEYLTFQFCTIKCLKQHKSAANTK